MSKTSNLYVMVGFSLTKGAAYKATIVNYNIQKVFKIHFDIEKNNVESFTQLDFNILVRWLLYPSVILLPLFYYWF